MGRKVVATHFSVACVAAIMFNFIIPIRCILAGVRRNVKLFIFIEQWMDEPGVTERRTRIFATSISGNVRENLCEALLQHEQPDKKSRIFRPD